MSTNIYAAPIIFQALCLLGMGDATAALCGRGERPRGPTAEILTDFTDPEDLPPNLSS